MHIYIYIYIMHSHREEPWSHRYTDQSRYKYAYTGWTKHWSCWYNSRFRLGQRQKWWACIAPVYAGTLAYVQCSAVQCSAVQCSSVQCSAVQCSAVQCSAVQCSAVQCSAVQCSAVQCSTVQYSTVQYSAVQCSAVQCSAVQCSAVQCSAVQCSAVQCSAVQCSAVQCIAQHSVYHRLKVQCIKILYISECTHIMYGLSDNFNEQGSYSRSVDLDLMNLIIGEAISTNHVLLCQYQLIKHSMNLSTKNTIS